MNIATGRRPDSSAMTAGAGADTSTQSPVTPRVVSPRRVAARTGRAMLIANGRTADGRISLEIHMRCRVPRGSRI